MRGAPRSSRSLAVLAVLGATALGAALLRADTPPATGRRAPPPIPARGEALPVPDDTVLLEQLEEAIELRRREDFDRFLDARDPGELIEHATLTQMQLDRAPVEVETLFVVGDELFGYRFRPENGWGRGGPERADPGFTPRLRRVHRGAAGGPDAFACMSCHSKGGPDGAGMQTQNALLMGDGERLEGADQRNPPHLLGLGPVDALAREMTAALQAQAAAAAARARAEGRRVEEPLVAKGIAFGRLAVEPDGTRDHGAIEGVDPDLIVRPFGWKGHQATLRDMVEESLYIHLGLLSMEIQRAVHEGRLDGTPYGSGATWHDLDDDGISFEIDSGMVTTVVGYLAQLEVPVVRPPRDPALLDAFAAGRARFDAIGCAGCHVPALQLDESRFDPVQADSTNPGRAALVVDLARDGEHPKIEPVWAGENPPHLVHLFSDLKRHDMGQDLASPAAQGTIPAATFLTRPLWGLAETAPYLHDGRAPTIHDAVVLHGGEAAAARDAYLALDEPDRAAVRVFLASLTRQPKLFIP